MVLHSNRRTLPSIGSSWHCKAGHVAARVLPFPLSPPSPEMGPPTLPAMEGKGLHHADHTVTTVSRGGRGDVHEKSQPQS